MGSQRVGHDWATSPFHFHFIHNSQKAETTQVSMNWKINKMWLIYTTEYYSPNKKNQVLIQAVTGKYVEICSTLLWTKLVEVIEFQLSYSKSWKMMLWKCCSQYASKFGKFSSGHRTGKGQFSFQSQRKTMPKNVQTTAQLYSSHMLAK